MRQRSIFIIIICLLITFVACEDFIPDLINNQPVDPFLGTGSYFGEYWPTVDWRSCRPEEVGMDSVKLLKVYEYGANRNLNTHGIIIVKDGYIVFEAYFRGYNKNSKHNSYGVANSFTNALVGIAIDNGLISSVNRNIYHYYSAWQKMDTPVEKKQITIRHLLTMTAGLEWTEDSYNNPADIAKMYENGIVDFIQYMLEKPVVTEPGTHWNYSSGESILLSGILEKTTNQRAYDFARQNLFAPLGISDIYWETDPAGHTITAWGIYATLRDYAKFGYLYLKEGQWDEHQIVSSNWIQESTTAISDSMNNYGYQWWLPPAFTGYEEFNIPDKTFIALGSYIQRIFVVPEKNLVAVRVGYDAGTTGGQWNSLQFLRLVLDAINVN